MTASTRGMGSGTRSGANTSARPVWARWAAGSLLAGCCALGWPALAHSASTIGQGVYTFWGWTIYQARLEAPTPITPDNWAQSAFTLKLNYQRSFSARDIGAQSLREMARQGPIPEAQAQAWSQDMNRCFRDVEEGDQLSGSFDGQDQVRFAFNGQPTCTLQDAAFARRFFGIWLGTKTSAPELRDALFGRRS